MTKKPTKPITGRRFGRLVAIAFVRYRRGKLQMWLCRCDCGTIKLICRSDLVRDTCSNTRSCGCLFRDQQKVLNRRVKGSKVGGYMKRPKIQGFDEVFLQRI